MKVDVIVIGSGIAGLAIAAALGRQKLKALVIGPDIAESNFDSEFVFENSTITNLPDIHTAENVFCSSSGQTHELPRTLLSVNSKSLYQRFLMSCADNGVGMMHGRAVKIVSYRKMHRVDWIPNQVGDVQLPKEELFAPLVIDASGASSIFSPNPVGFTSTFRKILRGSGPLFEGRFSYFENATLPPDQSFLRGFQHDDGRYFVDEVCLFSESPIAEKILEDRLSTRLEIMGFTIDDEFQTTYNYTPLFSEDRSSKFLAFGDASAMANPITGEATSRIINTAPKLAKVISESMQRSPQEIADLGREAIFSAGEKQFENALACLYSEISSDSSRHIFEALFASEPFFDALIMGTSINTETFAFLQTLMKARASEKAAAIFSQFEPS